MGVHSPSHARGKAPSPMAGALLIWCPEHPELSSLLPLWARPSLHGIHTRKGDCPGSTRAH
eukprot:4860250-Alexandrium_andersonii.AAC.1